MSIHTPKSLLCLALLALTACGGTRDAPTIPAAFLSQTFQFQYAGRSDDGDLVRETGSLRVLSGTILEVTVDGRTELIEPNSLSEGSEITTNPFVGRLFYTPGGSFAQYQGFFGFETPSDAMPTATTASYSAVDGSVIFAQGAAIDTGSYPNIDGTYGDTDLSVDFTNGTVSGDLHSSPFIKVGLADGTLSGNSLTGKTELVLFLGGLPFTADGTLGDVSGRFYGNDAQVITGTFDGLLGEPDMPGLEFVGTFSGTKNSPD